jgi:integrase/recombinase XerD
MPQSKFYLTKRRNGVYYILIKTPQQKNRWKSTHCRKKPEAMRFFKGFEEQCGKLKNIHIPTFSEFLKVYESIQATAIRKSTLELYKFMATRFIRLNSDKPLNEYTSLEFEQSRAKEIASGVSVTRMNMYTRAIKTLFNFAFKQNIISRNPLENIKQIKQPKSLPTYFSIADLEKILALVTNPVLRDIYITAFYTGMRISEILNLRWVNVDLQKKQIRVCNSEDFVTKTGTERTIPIHPKVSEMLSKIDKSQEYVFSKNGVYRYTRNYVSNRFKHYATKAGLPKNIKLHSARHSFASLCVQSGVDIYAVKSLLGHSNITTTQIYSHLSSHSLQDSINKLPS